MRLKLDPTPRTLVAVHLPQEIVRAAKAVALRQGVPFTRIVARSLVRYVREVREIDAQQPPEDDEP